MDFENRRYVIINTDDLKYVDFGEVLETSPETCTYCVDGTKTFIKYIGPQPKTISDLKVKSQEHTADEILQILQTPEWSATGD